jgi:CheY-like chemotaxis protein
MLEGHGYQVLQAPSGNDALILLQQPPEDLRLVLLDLTMPRMDGVQTFRLLRVLHPDLPVVLMSGYSQADVEARFPGERPADFLHKPFAQDELLAVVHRQISRKASTS